MNKKLYEELTDLVEYFKCFYGNDWYSLYYHDIDAVDMMRIVSLFIANVKDPVLVENVIKKVFDSEEPIGLMPAMMHYKVIM